MAPTPVQSTSRRIIPAEEWNKMSRLDKREYFKEQRILARARKPKEETSGRAEITVDSSTTMDTETMAAQISTAAMAVRQEIQPDEIGRAHV